MKTPFILFLGLIQSVLAGSPKTPCRSGSDMSGQKLDRNSIDAILAKPKGGLQNNPNQTQLGQGGYVVGGRWIGPGEGVRTNQDFIGTVDRVNIPGIPSSPSDKTQYNLFNPTPDFLLRGLAPDRPDATESPITVDAGRFQIEASLFDYRRDQSLETFIYGQVNLKAGLTHNIDLQAVLDLRSEAAGDWTTFGDLTIRLKYNIRGNDGGDTALAIIPYVTAPTRSDEWQGGIIVPWATTLTNDISLGIQGQLDFVNDDSGSEPEFLFTAVIGYPIIGKLGGYTEYIGVIAEDRYESYYSGGFTYEINENFVLDAGVQVGLNSDSEDFGCFTGFTQRF